MSFPFDFPFYLGGEASTSEELIQLYRDQLQKLLPPGQALSRRSQSSVTKWLLSFSPELARIHERLLDAYYESYPGTASERLDEWEELTGLPDECSYLGTTDSERRLAVLNRFAVLEGQSESDFEAIASDRGYTISIELWDVFRTGVQTIGHMPIYSVPWYFAMNVTYTPATAAEDAALECAITTHAHAHTVVHFNLTVGPPDYFVTHPR